MACFLVPAAEAVVVGAVKRIVKGKEEMQHMEQEIPKKELPKGKLSDKLGHLERLLAGGSVMLAFEHMWHGEIVPWFPFLTAVGNPADTAEMLHEMAAAGSGMAAVVTFAWAVMMFAADHVAGHGKEAEAVAEGAGGK